MIHALHVSNQPSCLDVPAPVISFVSDGNAGTTTGLSITVSGIDFGTSNATPTIGVGFSSCYTVSWASGTSLACAVTQGSQASLDVAASVSTVTGTKTVVFSYDGKAFVSCFCPSCLVTTKCR